MAMIRINIIYKNNNMPSDVLEPVVAGDGRYRVVWSRSVQPDSDVVVYFNHYTFNRRIHEKTCPKALKVLYMYEPAAVDPMQYNENVWRQFDAILTWNTYLTEASSAFTFEAGAYYDLPYCSHYGVSPITEVPVASSRRKAVCQICGDKYSLAHVEIYSERRRVSRWFHHHARTPMDVYGRPPMDTPNYRGECADKLNTFAQYRYALCFENTYDPFWSKGYLTEKIFDCMAACTIPIYYGCSNIEHIVPADCFIDFRRFLSLADLDTFLQDLTDEAYMGYVARMKDFLLAYNPQQRHSVQRLYETVCQVAVRRSGDASVEYPPDFRAKCAVNGMLRLAAMRMLFPCYRFIYPLFALARRVKLGPLK